MSREPQSPDADRLDPLVVHARRETLIILVVFAVCLVWSVSWCYLTGYPEPADGQIAKMFGIPAWVFWGVVVPWLAANGFTIWFCLFYMADDPLEPASESASGDEGETQAAENRHA